MNDNKNKSRKSGVRRPNLGIQLSELRSRVERLEVKGHISDQRLTSCERRLDDRDAFAEAFQESLEGSIIQKINAFREADINQYTFDLQSFFVRIAEILILVFVSNRMRSAQTI